MNQEVEVKILHVDGKDYLLLDTFVVENTYYYFSNIKDTSDIMVMKDAEQYFASIEDKNEFDYVLTLFYDKYRNYGV